MRGMSPDSLSGKGCILKVIAFVDGASRGNPGPAGYGVYMRTDSGEVIEISGFLGKTTNNVAEYEGLLEALRTAPRSRAARAVDAELRAVRAARRAGGRRAAR